ncbi:MAG: hypothetical protein JAY74_09140 [Candidatus Thiodiazotropha taylori]|nr:hypothetical protein [Candidatus Thiodiazotropha taylori]
MYTDNDIIIKEYNFLLRGGHPPKGLDCYFDWLLTHLLPQFIEIDKKALYYQSKNNLEMRLIYFVSPIIVMLVAIQGIFFPDKTWLVWGEVIGLIALLFVYRKGSKEKYLENWLENRFLAEKLRCSIFTGLHIKTKSTNESDNDDLALLDKKHSNLLLPEPPKVDWHKNFSSIRDFVIDNWIYAQLNYHKKVAEKAKNNLKKMEIAGFIIVIATLSFAVLHSLGVGHHTSFIHINAIDDRTNFTIGNLLTILALVLPAISASLAAIESAKEYRKIELRSGAIANHLQIIIEDAKQIKSNNDLLILITNLEKLFMKEHEEWFSIVAYNRAKIG